MLEYSTGLVRGDYINDCCEYQVDTSTGKLVPGSITCKRIFCYDEKAEDKGFVRCITLSVISPPAGAPIEELIPGNGTLPPSIAPGDSGPENNTSQNTKKVPKSGILDDGGVMTEGDTSDDGNDTNVARDSLTEKEMEDIVDRIRNASKAPPSPD